MSSSSSLGALLHPLDRLGHDSKHGLSALPQLFRQIAPTADANAVAPQTAQAVQAISADDVVAPSAQRMADIQAVIAQLNEAASAGDASDLLRSLSDLVNEGTQAGLIPDALGELADLADQLLSQADGGPVAFAVQAQFSFSQAQGDGYQQQLTSFSLRFSLATEDTKFDGTLAFQDSYSNKDGVLQYQSAERVNLRLKTVNLDPSSNAALASYGDLTQKLTGVDVLSGLQDAAPGRRTYVAISRQQQLSLYVSGLSAHSDRQQQLLEALKQLAQGTSQKAGVQEAGVQDTGLLALLAQEQAA